MQHNYALTASTLHDVRMGKMKILATVILVVVGAELALLLLSAQILVSEHADLPTGQQVSTHYCKYFTGTAFTVVIFPSPNPSLGRVSCPVFYRPRPKPAQDVPNQRSVPSMG